MTNYRWPLHKIVSIAILMAPSVVQAESWTGTEKDLYKSFIAGQIINYSNTVYVMEEENWHEINPFLRNFDKGELIAWKIFSTTSIGVISDNLSHKWRKRVLGLSNIVVFGIIGHDLFMGVGFRF